MAVKHYAGLDVSMRETSIYVVDVDARQGGAGGGGRIGAETIAPWLSATGLHFERVGLEAGSLGPAMCDGPIVVGLPLV